MRNQPDFAPHPFAELCDVEGVHYQLARWNHERLGPGVPHADWHDGLKGEMAMLALESTWVETLREEVFDRA